MMRTFMNAALGVGLLVALAQPAAAFPVPAMPPAAAAAAEVVPVANGCGWGWYRGPGGACHRYGHGPFPGGYFGPYGHSFALDHGCGAGRYRGPWGACHRFGTGPYPGGYFGPYYR